MEARWWLIGVWAQLVFALLLGRLWRTVATIAKQRRMELTEGEQDLIDQVGDYLARKTLAAAGSR